MCVKYKKLLFTDSDSEDEAVMPDKRSKPNQPPGSPDLICIDDDQRAGYPITYLYASPVNRNPDLELTLPNIYVDSSVSDPGKNITDPDPT